MEKEIQDLLQEIFFPENIGGRKRFEEKGLKLVHYTSAENAINIIKNKEIWLRNTQNMNDYMEVRHGLGLMRKFFQPDQVNEVNEGRKSLYGALNNIHPNLAETTIENINQNIFDVESNSYITSLSEHNIDENENGRLSMWRAYGDNSAKVAIVINPAFVNSDDNPLNAFSMKCSYFTDEQFMLDMDRVTKALIKNHEPLSNLQPDQLGVAFKTYLVFRMLSLKHPGFAEEQEWRLIYLPWFIQSDYIKKSIETVNRIPQPIYKIPLENFPDVGIKNQTVPELLDRIIIGPTENGMAIFDALVDTLRDAKVESPWDKVIRSNIPLRTS